MPAPPPPPRFLPPASAGPGGSAGTTLRAALVSAGVLAEPYRGEPPALPASAWVTPAGWRERWRRWLSGGKSMYTLAKCKKLFPGWELGAFKGEVAALHAAACAALAAGDRGALRHLFTPAEYAAAKRQLKLRAEAGWATVEWGLTDPVDAGRDVEVVHGRLVMANPRDERAGFAQVTARIRCGVLFRARDARGRVVAGEEGGGGGPPLAVQDVWVFERYLGGGPASRWRVAARLDVAPVERRGGGGWVGWLTGRRGK
jgi:large subunit ribosomal protein L45